jgi:hypothetical protein
MAVFTAIATAIVGAIGVAGTATAAATLFGSALIASVATSIIATGLAVGTAKILGVFKPPAATSGQDPGVKIQLGPSTDNKVPRLYGRNYTGAIVIDAEIKNQNKTMAYAMVISEYNTSDVWTINTVYRGDQQLVFGSGANAQQVISVIDPNATSSTSIANKFRVRVYAGNSESTSQIFPVPGGGVTAVDAYGAGSCQFANWTASNAMTDLVFAIVEMDYDSENDLVGLGAITFDINNALNEPSNVLLDYLGNERYGAGISNTMIDTASFNDWYTYADANVDYIDASNTTVQHSRYQIDGALNTFRPVIDNVSKICQAGGAFFTYNAKQGKFGVVVNRPASNTEISNAFVFDDDNITSGITITSTELYSLYNQIEVEYASVNQRDQTDLYFAEANANIRNTNEPDNCLKYRLDMVNDRSRVAQLANVDLNQSRINTILEFTADFSSMTVDVGDVVKVTLPLYGYNEKLFRAMRVTEQEEADGMINCKFTLLEYDADVYDDLLTREDLPLPVTGITNWWVLNSNAVLEIGNITVVNDPTSANAQQYYAANGAFAGNVAISDVSANFGAVFANTTFINVPIKPPVNTNYNLARIAVVDDSGANSAPVYYTQSPSSTNTYFADDEFFNFPISTNAFKRDLPFYLEIQTQDTLTGAASRVFTTAQLNVERSNTVGVIDVATFGAGAQFVFAGISNTSIAAGTTYRNITPVASIITHDLRGSDPGTYILEAAVTPGGTLTANTYSIAMSSNALVQFSNTTSNVSINFSGGGSAYANISSGSGIVPQIVDNQEVITDTSELANVFPGQISDDMIANDVTLWLQGFNTLDDGVAPRTMGDQKINFYKITKNSLD